MNSIFARLSFRDWLQFFSIAAAVVMVDQATKFLILQNFNYGDSKEIIPGLFNLVLTYNFGAAFGMLAELKDGTRQIVLGLTTLLALFVVFYFLLYEYRNDRTGRAALGLVFGGALGNVLDRLRIGKVVDFLDFYIGQNHWPAFNVADSAICIAVFILILHKPKKEPAS